MKQKIPKIWDGETAFVLGGGPTLLDTIADHMDALRSLPVVGVNSAYLLPLIVDVLFFGDCKFYWWNKAGIDGFRGMKITANQGPKHGVRSVADQPDLICVGVRRFKGLDKNPGFVAWNGSSGAAAINAAYHLGARRVVLVGFDMRRVDDRKNWIPHTKEKTNPNPYEYMIDRMRNLVKPAKASGLEILNATPASALNCFETTTMGEVIDANEG